MKVQVISNERAGVPIRGLEQAAQDIGDCDPGVLFVLHLSSEEISGALGECSGSVRHLVEIVASVLSNQSGPLVAEVARHVKIKIEDPTFGTALQTAINRGMQRVLSQVEDRMYDAAIRALNSGTGKQIGTIFGVLKRAADSLLPKKESK